MPNTIADQVFTGLCKGPWAARWANNAQNCGQSFTYQNIYFLAPEPPEEITTWAKCAAAELLAKNAINALDVLFHVASLEGFHGSAEDFGALLGCEIAGYSVSWDTGLLTDTTGLIEVPKMELP